MARIRYIPEFFIVLKALEKGEKTAMEIHREWLLSYSYVGEIRKHLVENGFITVSGETRQSKYMNLTDKGKKVVRVFNQLLDALGIDNETINLYRMKKQKPNKEPEVIHDTETSERKKDVKDVEYVEDKEEEDDEDDDNGDEDV